jgi:predicted DNA-binding transcriptional regulator AlpA
MSRKKSLPRIRLDYEPNPVRLYRPTRLAKLFDIDLSTLWRWEKLGLLPRPVQIGPGFKAWTEPDLKAWLDDLQSK